MSRSKHTRPKSILAADRVRNPREKRGASDPIKARRLRRLLKMRGVPIVEIQAKIDQQNWPLPMIKEMRPRRGCCHPANKKDLAAVLRRAGEEFIYGIQSIELRQGSPGCPVFGDYRPPGQIILYDQQASPWFLSPNPNPEDTDSFMTFGAIIQRSSTTVRVSWPGDSLRRFMLFGVLFHEMGHHRLQHYKGKRSSRIARTRDHEDFAHLFSRRSCAAFHGDSL
ncbi:MAG: hypothetical protein P1V97_27830 [Planctomycetota bacterium]|nr:hypothetical protein [Planctomycetota bacterium]